MRVQAAPSDHKPSPMFWPPPPKVPQYLKGLGLGFRAIIPVIEYLWYWTRTSRDDLMLQ